MNSQNILSKDEFKNEKFFWEKGLIPEAWKTPEEQETERWIQIRRKAVIAEKQVMQTAPSLYAPKAMQKALEAKQAKVTQDELALTARYYMRVSPLTHLKLMALSVSNDPQKGERQRILSYMATFFDSFLSAVSPTIKARALDDEWIEKIKPQRERNI